MAFYGARGDTAGGTSRDRAMKDLAASAAHTPLVVRDDLNELPPGAADILCRMATGGVLKMAEYFESLKEVTFDVRASILLSAYRPNWLKREDLLSRLLILRFKKRSSKTDLTERQRVADVLAARSAIWFETLAALNSLAVAGIASTGSPVTRFDDWEAACRTILTRAGLGAEFDSALRKMGQETVADPFLDMLVALASRPETRNHWYTAASLCDALAITTGVQDRKYTSSEPHISTSAVRDPNALGQLLAKILREGSAVIEVQRRWGPNNTSEWNLRPRGHGDSDVGR